MARSDLETALAIDELVHTGTYALGELIFEEGLGLVAGEEPLAPTEGKEWFTASPVSWGWLGEDLPHRYDGGTALPCGAPL